MSHITTLVVDFDDTIALTLNRDWQNALPNTKLIDKLNELYRQGWTIHIVTARGQLSCNGDCVAADAKYRTQIESWLTANNVLYTDLSFQKKLAAYYIDDKGLHPDDFVARFEQVPLKGGLSGATVIHDKLNDCVLKTADNTVMAVKWFQYVKENNICRVPKINSVIGETINMEYIKDSGQVQHSTVLDIIEKFRSFQPIYDQTDNKTKYIERCTKRLTADDLTEADIDLCRDLIHYAVDNTEISFSYGDLSKSNIIVNSFGYHYLIDPILSPDLLSSWQIDLAKYQLSALEDFVDLDYHMIAHQIGHLCRMLPYSRNKNKEVYQKQKQQLMDRLNVF